jgi:flap endonuclease-1
MGLPFKEIVASHEIPWEALAGRRLAVDGYNAIYQFLATIRQRDGLPFSDPNGHPTSHLIGVLYRTTSLLSERVEPVWVFDGKPPDLKAGTLRGRFEAKERAEGEWREALAAGDLETARRKAAATSRLTRPMVEEAKELLDALGVPCVQAPSEGEAQAARMAAAGQVWAVASEDYDSLLFGAPRLVRGLAARAKKGVDAAAQIIEKDALLGELGISDEELLLIGLLVGTDFNDGAAGIGPKRALKLVRQHLGWSATLSAAGLDEAEVAPVAELFRSPEVVEAADPVFRPLDEAKVLRLLVESHGFAEDRVRSAIRRVTQRSAAPAPRPDGRRQALIDRY